MTVLTKPFSDKKGDKLDVPLVEAGQVPPVDAGDESELQRRHPVIIFTARRHRVSSSTTLCLLVVALAVVSIGIVGGKILYDEYLSVSRRMPQTSRIMPQKFEGSARIPMDNDFDEIQKVINDMEKWSSDSNDWPRTLDSLDRKTFEENFEIDDDEQYEKIDVPDFRDGRNGRFIHDFNTNITGIIDITGHRCFVMPLNRANVLPPKNLFDLVHKMWEGYYKVDTAVVRENMRVVTPPITDTKSIGSYITRECDGMPIYNLEKYVGGVVKRSADLHPDAKFAQFAGRGIMQIDIVNLDEVIAYEKQQKDSD